VRVLVAEDDPALRSVIARGLEEAGYIVDAVGDGGEALAYLDTYEYEIGIFDWRMPKLNGIELVQELRRRHLSLPVLLLTARDLAADRVEGLDAGADDYLVKPFDFGELLARLRALRRRPQAARSDALELGDVSLDPATLEVRIAGDPVELTPTELRILELLMERSPAVVSRSSIAIHAWQDEADAVGSNTIDVHVARLRSKLTGSPVRIETIRGTGYRMVTRPT
jgi:two-component system copper resistance phosphate regulon response regulator CusR